LTINITLSGPEIGEFIGLLTRAFDRDQLKELVQSKLNVNLFRDVASANTPLQDVSSALVTYLNNRGRVGELLDAVVVDQPQAASLHHFAARVQEVRKAGVPYQSPPLLAHYVRRPHEEARLEHDLLRQDEGPGVVVSAVFGLGGIGKSTLAAAVVQSRRVQERFSDGVLWVTLGQNPELLSLAGQWIRDLGDHDFRAVDLRAASGRLRQLLQDRAVLLVVDDAWQSEHVEPFRVGGPRCRLLVTTRRARIADDLHAIALELDVLSPDQAVQLLATRLKRPLEEQEHEAARRLAEAVGHLPLALELAAVRIGRKVSWEELLQRLEQEVAALEALEDPAQRWKRKGKTQLEASLQLSLRALCAEAEEAYRCFVWLGVLPDDTTLAAPMASALWDMPDEGDADGLLEFLWGEALLQPAAAVRVGDKKWRAYRVHDLLHDCARRLLLGPAEPGRVDDLPGLGLTRPQAHRQLLERYRSRTGGGQWYTLAPDGYIHGRLGWHLEQAGDIEGLHALLREETPKGRNGWFEANERLGQPSNFADSISQAWRLADKAFGEGQPAPTLGLQCRYALVTASLNSLANKLPPALLEALVRQGLWPVEQALAYARRTLDARQKVQAVAALLPLLPQPKRAAVLPETLTAARAIRDEGFRSDALAALSPQLPVDLRSEALAIARTISNQGDRSKALVALAPYLPEPARTAVPSEALNATRAIRDDWPRSTVLATLIPDLPDSLLSEALNAARSIEDVGARVKALAALVPHLAEPARATVLSEALTAARAANNGWALSQSLGALVPYLLGPARAAVLSQALTAARAIEDEWYRSLVLAKLAQHLPVGLHFEALTIARAISYADGRTKALVALAPHLSEQERAAVLSEALIAARAIKNDRDRSTALVALAAHLPDQEGAAVLSEALDVARDIEIPRDRSEALAALTPHLPASLLSEALNAVRAIGDEWTRSEALNALEPHLAAGLLSEARNAARATENQGHHSTALVAMAPNLSKQKGAAVLTEALNAARAITNDRDRYTALLAVAPHLPETARAQVFSLALNAARAIGDKKARSDALTALAPHLAERERATALSEALRAARAIEEARDRCQALGDLVPHLPGQERSAVLSEALTAACGIRDEQSRSQALAVLAPDVLEPECATVLSETLAAARTAENAWARSQRLGALAPWVPEPERTAVLSDALNATRAIGDDWPRSRALAALIPHLPAGLLPEALKVAHDIGDEKARFEALVVLAPHMPEPARSTVLSDALNAARTLGDKGARAQALTTLTPYLPEQERAGVLSEARIAAHAINFARGRCYALAEMAPHLAEQERATALSEALRTARAIDDARDRCQALADLVPHLPRQERSAVLSEALTAACGIRDEQSRSQALAAVIPLLPVSLLSEALNAALALEGGWERSRVLKALTRQLAGLDSQALTALWRKTLRVLAHGSRHHLLTDLPCLNPVLIALAGSNTPTELREVARAITDVTSWWP
jgi:hypothetical protein